MINASGRKVWPAEVEAALNSHPAILEACVISSPAFQVAMNSIQRRAFVLSALSSALPLGLSLAQAMRWRKPKQAFQPNPRREIFPDEMSESGQESMGRRRPLVESNS
jgi:acyl-coenzyme A synthetase/AMP-(fatty) acid ligase